MAHPLPYQSIASAHFPPTLNTCYYSSVHSLYVCILLVSSVQSVICSVLNDYYWKNFKALDFDSICLSTLLYYSCMVTKCSSITKENWLCFLITYYLHLWRVLSFMKDFTHIREQLITERFLDWKEIPFTWNTYNITSCQYSRLLKNWCLHIFRRSMMKGCLWKTTGRSYSLNYQWTKSEGTSQIQYCEDIFQNSKFIRLQQGFQLKIMKCINWKTSITTPLVILFYFFLFTNIFITLATGQFSERRL